jgi:hypothetical protein
MAGEDSDDPCPLCGAAPFPAARVTLPKRRLFPADSSATAARVVAGLQAELEAERAAAADAASEAMSMILRLQRDKSEAMIEARQYRRYAEERLAHDAAEAEALRGAVGRRDAAVRALSAQLRECQVRLLHLGYDPPPSPFPPSSPLAIQDHHAYASGDEDDHHPPVPDDHPPPADVGTPRTHHLLNRMSGQDPPPLCISPRHSRSHSNDSFSYALADEYPLYAMTTDRDAPDEDDDGVDRVYTVDTVRGVAVPTWQDKEEEAAEIQKLKARLQALEAGRESMRHAIVSMGDEKAQVLLLRDIAQQLCKEGVAVPTKVLPQPVVVAQRKLVKRLPCFVRVFVVTVIKVNIFRLVSVLFL